MQDSENHETLESQDRAETFHQYRGLLFSIAYRMLGSVADAEDMLEETFIRWQQPPDEEIRSPRAFLVTIISRLCINHLQSARVQCEEYIGQWLPHNGVVASRLTDAGLCNAKCIAHVKRARQLCMRLAVCTIFLTVLTLRAQERQVGQGVNVYSTEREAALGAQLANEVRQKTTPVASAVIRDYVEKIGRQLATPLPNPRFTYTFAVIADDSGGQTHEPLSLPAGYIFVPANLILTAQNEAEFAGMLAHAMAHVAERHGTRQATRGELANVASVPLIFMSGWTGLGAGGNEPAVPISFLSTQRRFETEADVLAIKLTSGAGYDPKALVSYISRVQPGDADGSQAAKVFSALPPRDLRITSMEKAIQELPPREYVPSSEEFPRIQAELRRLLQR